MRAETTESEEKDKPPGCRVPYLLEDFRFLKSGYFLLLKKSLAHGNQGDKLISALDFFCVPILLEVAGRHGIPVCSYHITTKFDFRLPAIVYPLNPFMHKPKIARTRSQAQEILASLTRNHTYPVCVEALDGKLSRTLVVNGNARNEKYQKPVSQLYGIFGIPVFIAYFAGNERKFSLSGTVPVENGTLKKIKREEVRISQK
ncbi:MAG: hypothetical protein ACPL1Y_04860 [Thermoplasmata archaeon]